MRLSLRWLGCAAVAALVPFASSSDAAYAGPSFVVPNSMDAGYFTSGLTPTSASTKFVLPSFTCTGVQEDLILVEVNWSLATDGHGADEIIIECAGAGAAPSFTTFVVAGGTDLPGPSVEAGDTLKASISGSATQSSVKLVNVTTGKKVTASGGAQTNAGVNALFVIVRNDATTPTFGRLTFESLTVDSTALTATTSFSQDMTSASSVVQAHAKPIASGTGAIAFKHA